MYVYNAHYMFALTTHCVKIGVLGGGGGGGGGAFGPAASKHWHNIGGGGGGRVCF